MTQHGPWVLQTIESNVVGAAVGAIVGSTVTGLYKRAVRLEAARVESLLLTLDHLLGGNAAETQTPRKGTMNPTLSQYRKGIAAGFGVVLTGLLTWAESANLEPVLGPLVPEPFRPLVGVVLGGVALTASVILTSNAPAQVPAVEVPTAAQPALATPGYARRGSSSSAPSIASLVAGVPTASSVVSSETSVVQLLAPPTKTYQ